MLLVTGFNERGNTDRFHRFDLNTSNIIGQSRIENLNSTTGSGFGIGQLSQPTIKTSSGSIGTNRALSSKAHTNSLVE